MISDRMPENYNPRETVLNSSDLVPPSFSRSVFNSTISAGLSGYQAINVVSGLPNKNLNETYNGIEEDIAQEDRSASTGQKVTRFLPKMIGAGLGYMTNPITAALTLGAEAATGGLGVLGARFLPKIAAKPVSQAIGVTSKGAAAFAGMSIPDEVIQNFNQDTRSLNWGGFTEGVLANGAIGSLFSATGFAAGVIWHGIGEKGAAPMPGTKEAKSALKTLEEKHAAGDIPTDQFEWYRDMLTDPHRDDLQERATKILGEKGHEVDSAKNKAYFEMLSPDDMQNLKSIFPQQLNDLMEDKTALSDYVIHSKLDEIRENPEKVDGLRGSIALMDHKLEGQKKKLKEADKILKDHLMEGVENRMPFDQHDIYEIVNKGDNNNFPMTIPDHVEKKLRDKEMLLLSPKEELEHIKEKLFPEKERQKNVYYRGFKEKLEHGHVTDPSFGEGYWMSLDKSYAKGYGSNLEKIEGKFNIYDPKTGKDSQLNKLFEKISSISKEIREKGYSEKTKKLRDKRIKTVEQLRKLAKKKGYEGFERDRVGSHEIMLFEKPKRVKNILVHDLEKNFANKKEYQRLTELADVWHNAQSLLDRVHLEADYRQTEAQRIVAQKFLDVFDSNIDKFADRDRVVNYLKKRIEDQNGLVGENKPNLVKEKAPERRITEGEHAEQLEIYDEEISQTNAKNIKDEFYESKKRYNQFKENSPELEKMIDCMGRK